MGDLGSIPGLRRSPGEGKGYPLQHSGLDYSMDCIVHGVTKSRTQLSNFHFSFTTSLERFCWDLRGGDHSEGKVDLLAWKDYVGISAMGLMAKGHWN